MKKYHYVLRDRYEAVFPFLPLTIHWCAPSFDIADEFINLKYGVKTVLKYRIFSVTKL